MDAMRISNMGNAAYRDEREHLAALEREREREMLPPLRGGGDRGVYDAPFDGPHPSSLGGGGGHPPPPLSNGVGGPPERLVPLGAPPGSAASGGQPVTPLPSQGSAMMVDQISNVALTPTQKLAQANEQTWLSIGEFFFYSFAWLA